MTLHEHLPSIIGESVKPIEKIQGMKIISIDGLSGLGTKQLGGMCEAETTSGQSLPEALVGSALKHRAMAPMVDALLKEAGVTDFSQDLMK